MRYPLLFSLVFTMTALQAQETSDPFLWLEEVEGEKALEWVRSQNERSLGHLEALPYFQELFENGKKIFNSKDRLAYPGLKGEYVYNFWQDSVHVRGIWRRTPLNAYLSPSPEWETVLDMDALGEKEGKKWVFKGADFLEPENTRCLLRLSDGGKDAVEVREFDAVKKAFVEDGFRVPEGKTRIDWKDENTVYISTDFGEGSLTTSGYPRIVKVWKRGKPLTSAKTIFEGAQEDVSVAMGSHYEEGKRTHFIYQSPSFFEHKIFLIEEDKPQLLPLPLDADPTFFKGQMVLLLKSEWKTKGYSYPQGALISISKDSFMLGRRNFSLLRAPEERSTVEGIATTQNRLLLNILHNVTSELYEYRYDEGAWTRQQVPAHPLGNISIVSTANESDHYFFTYQNFLKPTSLYMVHPMSPEPKEVASLPAFFDADSLEVQQLEAISTDSTPIPYFLVAPKSLAYDSKAPTILNGYGGFEISETPRYSAGIGINWLTKGGVYVLANIRGGGEFGPAWHQAALKENRQRAFDDFAAVAKDLIRRKITSPEHLGIMGGSNGGLLVGAAFTQHPELYNAVGCMVPLLDMQRYNKLLAGASWMGEYGNPDIPEEWAYIQQYSPYHNLAADKKYPEVLFVTSTRDDRVHPGHARKMLARMLDMGHEGLLYENIEGGHAGSSTTDQRAYMWAVVFSYFRDKLFPD